jgi:protein SCO1/2
MSWLAPTILAASLALGVAPPDDAALPRGIALQDAAGRAAVTDDLLGVPLVLAPVSYRCPDLCGVTQRWLADALRRSGARAGRDYRLAVVSFDPRDRPEDAAQARAELFPSPGEPIARASRFLVATPEDGKRIFAALGFSYAFDEERDGAPTHSATVAVLREDGKLAEWLPAFAEPAELAAALERARRPDRPIIVRALVWCGLADPENGRYTADVLTSLRIAAAATAAALAGYVALSLRRRRK